jgi:hypothetical protein
MGEVVELALHKWQRYVRQLEQQPPTLGTPSQGTAMPTLPTTVCVFDPDPSGEPLLLWPGAAEHPTPTPLHCAVLLNWPKAPR